MRIHSFLSYAKGTRTQALAIFLTIVILTGTASASVALFEDGFEDGTFTDDWTDKTQTGAETTVDSTYVRSGSYALNQTSDPGKGTAARVLHENYWTGQLNYTVKTYRYYENGSQNTQLIRLTGKGDSDRFLTLEEDSGNLTFRETNSTRDTVTKTDLGVNIPMNSWTNLNIEVLNSTHVRAEGAGASTTVKTNNDWTNITVSPEIRTVAFDAGDKIGASYDDVVLNGDKLPKVSGRAVTQSGAPIENATIVVYGSKQGTAEDARNHIDTVANPIPSEWDNQKAGGFSLIDSGGAITNSDGRYALIYNEDDLGAPWDETANLKNPLWKNVPTGEQVSFIVGKQSNCGLISNIQEYDRQIPGCTADSGTITIEKLSPTGGVVKTDTRDISKETDGGFLERATVNYASYTFENPGIYRISPEGSDVSYLVKAGSMRSLVDRNLKDVNGTLTKFSQRARDDISGGSLVRNSTTTNASGHYSISVPAGVKVVQVQAVHSSGVDVSTSNPMESVRNSYDSDTPPTTSLYLPSTPKRAEVPSNDVTIRMTEVSFPPNGELSKVQDQLQDLRERLRNQGNNVKRVVKTTGEQTKTQLQTSYAELAGLIRANPALKDAYLSQSDRTSVAKTSDLSKSELRTETAHMSQALAMTAGSGTVSEEDTELTNSSVTKRWQVNGIPIDSANVSVIAHWSNGTTQPVSGEYITVNDNAVGNGGTVVLEDYPIGSKQPAAVEFALTVAGDQGIARGNAQVKNPTFNGDLPSLASAEFSTLSPGPSDTATLQLHPTEQSKFGTVKNATVYAPDGSSRQANLTGDDTIRFKTNGRGVHTIEATVTNAGGTEFVETFRIRASSSDMDRPPSITAASSPVSGVYAVVGDGLSGGDVEMQSDKVTITGKIPAKNDAPRRLHVYTSSLSANVDTPTEVQIVRGDTEKQVRKNLYVTWHTKTIPDEGIVWREDNQPLTRSGGEYGSVEVMSNQTVVETYTTSQGEVTVDVSPSPGLLERVEWTWRKNVPDVNVPGLMIAPPEAGTTQAAT